MIRASSLPPRALNSGSLASRLLLCSLALSRLEFTSVLGLLTSVPSEWTLSRSISASQKLGSNCYHEQYDLASTPKCRCMDGVCAPSAQIRIRIFDSFRAGVRSVAVGDAYNTPLHVPDQELTMRRIFYGSPSRSCPEFFP